MVSSVCSAQDWTCKEDPEKSRLLSNQHRQKDITTYTAEPSFTSDKPRSTTDEPSSSSVRPPSSAYESSSTSGESSTSPNSLSWSQGRLQVACLSSSSFLAGCCSVIQAPFYSYEAHLRGLSNAAASTVFSYYALSQLLAFPVMGWLAPRLGVTRLYLIGLLLAGLTTVAFGLLTYVDHPTPFLAACLVVRAAEAVGTAATMTAGRTIIINRFPRQVNNAMSVLEAMIGAGQCLGPALGGGLYTLGGYGAPFYTLGALLLATAAASLFIMPTATDDLAEKTDEGGGGSGGQSYGRMVCLVLSTLDNWLICAVLLVTAMNWTGMDPNMEPYMHSTLDISPAELSLFFLKLVGWLRALQSAVGPPLGRRGQHVPVGGRLPGAVSARCASHPAVTAARPEAVPTAPRPRLGAARGVPGRRLPAAAGTDGAPLDCRRPEERRPWSGAGGCRVWSRLRAGQRAGPGGRRPGDGPFWLPHAGHLAGSRHDRCMPGNGHPRTGVPHDRVGIRWPYMCSVACF